MDYKEKARELDYWMQNDIYKAEADKQLKEAEIIIRRFKNHCNIVGYPSQSFKKKVSNWIKQSTTRT